MPLPNLPPASGVLAAAERNPLLLRVATGLVLVVVALAAVWFGGMAFAALVAAATLVMFSEWAVMHRLGRLTRLIGLGSIAFVILFTNAGSISMAFTILGLGAFCVASQAAMSGTWLASRKIDWRAAMVASLGVLFCALPALALIWVRNLTLGLQATVYLLVIVWATDIAAYFAGRAIGGAKLAPSISPNKTWAGAVGGVVGAMLVAGGLAIAFLASVGGQGAWKFIGIAAALSALSILGDLFESWLKRRAGVKDSGSILPGHGGVMDRLDGLVPVAIAGAALFAVTGWAG